MILRVVILPALWEAAIGLTISSRAFSPLTQSKKYKRASMPVCSDAILQSLATNHVATCSTLQRRVVAASCLRKRE